MNQPGRVEKVKLKLPPGVLLTPMPEKTLSEMLVSGEIDAALTAHPPDCFFQDHPNIRRLFENFVEVEKRYIRETGIFPIMHIIAIRKDLVNHHPWIAMNLFIAFEEAKNRSLGRALFVGSRYPIPWSYQYAREAQKLSSARTSGPTESSETARPSTHSCNTPMNRASVTAAWNRKICLPAGAKELPRLKIEVRNSVNLSMPSAGKNLPFLRPGL